MLVTEYNQEKVMEKERQEGAKKERSNIIAELLKNGAPLGNLYKTFGVDDVNKIADQKN